MKRSPVGDAAHGKVRANQISTSPNLVFVRSADEADVVFGQNPACFARVGLLNSNHQNAPFSELFADKLGFSHIVSKPVSFQLPLSVSLFVVVECSYIACSEDQATCNVHVTVDCGLDHVKLDTRIARVGRRRSEENLAFVDSRVSKLGSPTRIYVDDPGPLMNGRVQKPIVMHNYA